MTLAQYSQQDLIHRAMCSHRQLYEAKAAGVLSRSADARAWESYYVTLAMLVGIGDMEDKSIMMYRNGAKPKCPVRVFRNYLTFKIEELRAEAYLGIDNSAILSLKRLDDIMESIREQAEREDEDEDGRIESLHAADFERNAYGTD